MVGSRAGATFVGILKGGAILLDIEPASGDPMLVGILKRRRALARCEAMWPGHHTGRITYVPGMENIHLNAYNLASTDARL